MLRAEEVSHHFYHEQGQLLALRGVSLEVGAGEFAALVGPSGSGKTTLLRMFAGLEKPEEGVIRFDGELLRGPPTEMGMVFQQGALLPWRTVYQNIALPYEVAGVPVDAARVATLIERVGLAGFERTRPHELSGGMRQRVALARAMVRSPRLWLLDEPFVALDMLLRQEMNDLVLSLWEERRPTVLFVTHDLAEAVYLADRVIVVSPRPGHVVGSVPVTVGRPRHAAMRYGAALTPFVEEIWRMMGGVTAVDS